jgi:geranylgeranyl reductase family protein
VGAGPAGSSAALHLSYAGIPSVIVDKAIFPRDKVCGDGISGRIPELLRELDPALYERFHQHADIHIGTWGVRFFAHDSNILEAPFYSGYDTKNHRPPGYICRRTDFDLFFVNEMKRRNNISFHDNIRIEHFQRTDGGFIISNKDGSFKLQAKLLIMADGADSAFSRRYVGNPVLPAHNAAAVRGYFQHVEGFHGDNFVEFYFIDKVIPGYLWIFPHPNGTANVGLGMRTDVISKRKVNLRTLLMDTLREHPLISPRFRNAVLVDDKLFGHSVPLGSKRRVRSGDHFLLAGDAAGLVDPLTGGGIANSFLSGRLAAEQAAKCLDQQEFSASFMHAYDEKVHARIGKAMQQSYLLQKLLQHSVLVRFVINFLSKRPRLFDRLSRLQMKLAK